MKKVLVLLLISLLLFSGCIRFHINQKIHSNLDSDYEIKMDLSGLVGFIKSMPSDDPDSIKDFDANFSKMCDGFKEEDIAEFENFKCEVDMENYIMIMSGTKSLKDDESITVEYGLFNTYKFDVSKGRDVLESVNSDSLTGMDSSGALNTGEMDDAMLQQMKAMGFEMTYTLEMPGTITKSDIGEIKDNKLEVDLLALSGDETFYVESEELNPVYGGGIALAVIIVLALIILLLKRRKKEFYGEESQGKKEFNQTQKPAFYGEQSSGRKDFNQ